MRLVLSTNAKSPKHSANDPSQKAVKPQPPPNPLTPTVTNTYLSKIIEYGVVVNLI
jgi:hypothetical protein